MHEIAYSVLGPHEFLRWGLISPNETCGVFRDVTIQLTASDSSLFEMKVLFPENFRKFFNTSANSCTIFRQNL